MEHLAQILLLAHVWCYQSSFRKWKDIYSNALYRLVNKGLILNLWMFMGMFVSHLRPWILSKGDMTRLLSWITFESGDVEFVTEHGESGFYICGQTSRDKIYQFIPHYRTRMRCSLVWKALTTMVRTCGMVIGTLFHSSLMNIHTSVSSILKLCKIHCWRAAR